MNIEIRLNLVDESILSKTGKETKKKKNYYKNKSRENPKKSQQSPDAEAKSHQMPKPRADIDNTVGDTACGRWD